MINRDYTEKGGDNMANLDKHQFPSVHCGITRAAIRLLALEHHPAAARFGADAAEIMAAEAAEPDRVGDRQQGRGRHYYCAVTPDGRPRRKDPAAGCYLNGKGAAAPSPLPMLEAEYRAALALYRAGLHTAALQSLSRAVHMLADVCCPPHSSGLTYFSRYAMMHKRYEAQAAALFWRREFRLTNPADAPARWAERARGQVPFSVYGTLLTDLFALDQPAFRGGFLRICNIIAQSGGQELPAVLGADDSLRAESIRRRLTLSIAHAAALLAAFDRDVQDPDISVWIPGKYYRLYAFGKPGFVFRDPLTPELLHDGAIRLRSASGACLAVGKLGKVLLTEQTAGLTVKYRFGFEPRLTIFPDGDQSRLLTFSGGRLRCISRSMTVLPGYSAAQSAFRLVPAK